MIRRHSASARLPSPGIAQQADDDVAAVLPVRPRHADELTSLVEVVLGEFPRREPCYSLGRRGEHSHDLVGVGDAEPVGAQQLLMIWRQRPDWFLARRAFTHSHALADALHVEHAIAAVGKPHTQYHLLQAGAGGQRC
jgi:hypothetical protein